MSGHLVAPGVTATRQSSERDALAEIIHAAYRGPKWEDSLAAWHQDSATYKAAYRAADALLALGLGSVDPEAQPARGRPEDSQPSDLSTGQPGVSSPGESDPVPSTAEPEAIDLMQALKDSLAERKDAGERRSGEDRRNNDRDDDGA